MAYDTRPAKRILFDEEGVDKLYQGIAIVSRAVGLTMGPKGWNVVMRLGGPGGGKPVTTKDGVSVANHIMLEDPEEDMGAQMAIEASRRTNDEAGDGTTCTVVLLHAMLEEARKLVRVGVNPLDIQRGMLAAKDGVLLLLSEMSREVKKQEDLYNVALVSCQDAEIAKKISDVILDVGEYGSVTVEAIDGPYGVSWAVKRGMHFPLGYDQVLTNVTLVQAQEHVRTKGNKPMAWQNDDVAVLVFDEPVRLFSDISSMLESLSELGLTKLLLIADVRDDAAAGIRAQIDAGTFTVCTINRAQLDGDFGREILKDICVYSGARFFSHVDGQGLPKTVTPEQVQSYAGRCSVLATRDTLTLTAGAGAADSVKKRTDLIEGEISEGGMDEYGKQKFRERLARFRAGLGTVKISAPTEIERNSLRTRVDDAVCSVRSANEEGILPGGGVALLRCYQYLKKIEGTEKFYDEGDTMYGRRIVVNALLRPMWTIADVAGESGDVRVHEALKQDQKSSMGYNYWTRKDEDLFETGVVDPTKVVRLCVENAVSVVGELLRTRVTITEMPTATDSPIADSKGSSRAMAQRQHQRRAQR